MSIVLRRIGLRLEQLNRAGEKLSEAALSRRAGKRRGAENAEDTIRNWRRRLESRGEFGASTSTIQAIADELKVTVAWLAGEGPDDPGELSALDLARAKAQAIFDSLPDELLLAAVSQLDALAALAEKSAPPPPARKAAKARK
ncbi:MAG: hypothetical protein ABIO40_08305 [Devosia sp.]